MVLSPLRDFSLNVYSQNGEDGIIAEILSRFSNAGVSNDEWCVEFGAWDGIYLSNTYSLIKDQGYKAVLIEGDAAKHKVLCKNIQRADVYKICRFVDFDGESTLDKILETTPIPKDFDLLSIDIDGCDYHIFKSMEIFKPKIVCIEYNSNIPNEVEYIQDKDFLIKRGSSARSLLNLANKKNYSLVEVTHTNLIIVRNDLMQHVLPNKPTLEELRDDNEKKIFIFAGYDGTILSNKSKLNFPHHEIHCNIEKIQYLPKHLRKFPSDYNRLKRYAFLIWLSFVDSKHFFRKLKAMIKFKLAHPKSK